MLASRVRGARAPACREVQADIRRHGITRCTTSCITPWLDYEYYEEPDDSSGEIDGHLFSAQLSEAAKGFLVAERFFETPSFPEEENIDEGAGQFRD